jgi:hypothetical protein
LKIFEIPKQISLIILRIGFWFFFSI